MGDDGFAGFLGILFQKSIAKNHLVDIQPPEVMPTWRNGRSGVESIQKRLDRVCVSDSLLVDSS
jgi:hypothetical protein